MTSADSREPMSAEHTGRGLQRRHLLKLTGAAVATGTLAAAGDSAARAEAKPQWNNTWDKTFPRSKKADHKKVSFKNRYGIELVADLYNPKGLRPVRADDGRERLRHPGVRCLLQRRERRHAAQHRLLEAIVDEDFSAAVDYLGTRRDIDRERIGVNRRLRQRRLLAGRRLIDPRLKAVATVSMCGMGRLTATVWATLRSRVR